MARPFKRLRMAMANADVDEPTLARELGLSRGTVSSRLNGHTEWSLREMYAILRLLGRPASDLPWLFPPGGQNEAGCSRGDARRTARGFRGDAEMALRREGVS